MAKGGLHTDLQDSHSPFPIPCRCQHVWFGQHGTGLNLVALCSGVMVGHSGTTTKTAQMTLELYGISRFGDKSLEALALRKRAQIEF